VVGPQGVPLKPHFIVRLADEERVVQAPSWVDVLHNNARALERLHPDIDRLLDRYRTPVYITSEYPLLNGTGSPDEIRSGLNRVYRLILQQDGVIPPDLIREIQLLPVVRYARIGAIAGSELPRVEQTSRRRTMHSPHEAIGLEDAHAFTKGMGDIRIAVLDTGVDLTHPELEGKLEQGFDFVDIINGASDFIGDHVGADEEPEDEVGHGTHVSGIIASRGKKMPGGVAPNCTIVPVRVLAAMSRDGQKFGAGLIDNINTAVKWAVDQDVDIISMSLGVRHEGGGIPHEDVVSYAKRKGVTIVAASGNDGRRELYYPGALPHVIAVGAADEQGQVASFSTYGDQVSLIAPGENIFSCFVSHGYAVSSGTSQAAPFVTGTIGLMKAFARQQGKRLTDSQIKHVLKNTADKVDKRFKHPKAGFGMLNAADALRWLSYQFDYSQRTESFESARSYVA
jgi:thermitase